MIVVADTSPLNYLALTGYLDVLPQLFGKVIVPRVVLAELAHPVSPPAVREFAANPPAWLEVHDDIEVHRPMPSDLDPGETIAILLAHRLHADFLLIDDARGKTFAANEGLRVMGTVGLLRLAAQMGCVDLATTFDRLKATTFRVSPAFLDALLVEHRRSTGENS